MPGINYVLGESGTGKTTYMRALQERSSKSVAIRDPDSYFPPDMSVADVTKWVVDPDKEWRGHIERILKLTEDNRILNTPDDVLTPVGLLSRGERQRFLFALAWSKVRRRFEQGEEETFVFLDEFTSAQDHTRASIMWKEMYATLKKYEENPKQRCRVFIATHDPESLKKERWYSPNNRTFWFSKSTDDQPAQANNWCSCPICHKTSKPVQRKVTG